MPPHVPELPHLRMFTARGALKVVTAQGHTLYNGSTGFSIHNCTIGAASKLVTTNYSVKTFLGHPWKGFSRTVYMQSYVKRMVEAVGWMTWNDSFALSTLYYGEYQNYAPSTTKSGRVQWLGHRLMNMTNAYKFTVNNFITGEV
ncbi:probable pectinesterase/pectinesterase inhibitor 41 [Zingiber officinale]|uniref:probable pectinesterase/pectinesterase inhibitor 41 n=1 Tax=Zingiber officinale TaxID=94328 RepID=UPI001C4B73D8|nr:probable pectinesterase/pectinesterase inhibitor 41 [Zingiber officinale]